jgi:pimeloyl-ACP methyl ester carboxylesterase
LYYEHSGSGPPVVYIHGGFASLDTVLCNLTYAWTWENDFAAKFHFITYDRRGCYRSSCPNEGYELANQARDLECLLDPLQIPSAHLIGSSAGGPIAILFAATQPQRVRSLALAGTGLNLFPQDEPISDVIRRHVGLLEQQGAEAAFHQRPDGVEVTLGILWEIDEMKERGQLQEYWQRHRSWVKQAEQLPKAQRIQHYAAELKNMKAYMDVDLYPYAKQVTVPTLVIHGSNDREVPVAWGEELARAIPTARMHIMQGHSHSLVIRHVEVRQAVISFIQQTESNLAAQPVHEADRCFAPEGEGAGPERS